MTTWYDKEKRAWRYRFWRNKVPYFGYCVHPVTGARAKNRTEARNFERAEMAKVPALTGQAASGIRPGAFTIGQAADLYRADKHGRHKENVRTYVRELLGYFGPATAVTDISLTRVVEYRTWAQKQPVLVWKGGPKRDPRDPRNRDFWKPTGRTRGPHTVNLYLDALSGILDAAHRHRDPITNMPALPFPPPVERLPEPKRKPTPMDDADLEAIEQEAVPWVADAAELARLFGLRLTEALSSTRHWIDRQDRGLRIPEHIAKSGNEEFLPAGPDGMALLERLAEQALERGVDHLVTWPGPGGLARLAAAAQGRKAKPVEWRPLKNFRRALGTAKKRAGLVGDGKRRRFHDVRARFITGIAAGASDHATMLAARHADPKTTQGYIQLVSEEVRSAIASAETRRERRKGLTVVKTGTESHTELAHGAGDKLKDAG